MWYGADSGDAIKRVADEPESNNDISFLTFEVHTADDDAVFAVRVFSDSRLGILRYKDRHEPTWRTVARLDCRPGVQVPSFWL